MLAHELIRIDEQAGHHSTTPDTRDILIFLFSLDHELPMFVDVSHRSRYRTSAGVFKCFMNPNNHRINPYVCIILV